MGNNSAENPQSLDFTQSGIQVLDRALYILRSLGTAPMSLTELCKHTGLPRATVHRIIIALEKHRFATRTPDNRWMLGPAIAELVPDQSVRLEDVADQILPTLRNQIGESVQLYKLSGLERICIAAAEPPTGLRNTVPVGHLLPLTAGSAAQVFIAFGPERLRQQILPQAQYSEQTVAEVKESGIAESINEREVGLASTSVPVFNGNGTLLAVLSASGPAERMSSHPAEKYGQELRHAAQELGTLAQTSL